MSYVAQGSTNLEYFGSADSFDSSSLPQQELMRSESIGLAHGLRLARALHHPQSNPLKPLKAAYVGWF